MNVEALKAVGGNEWIKGDKHRVYFTQVRLIELVKAQLAGETLSNTRANHVVSLSMAVKVWFDVPTGQFQWTSTHQEWEARPVADRIISSIKAKAQAA